MKTNEWLYDNPLAMEPLFPAEIPVGLINLATDLYSKSGALSAVLHPITRNAVAEFFRPMNSYYSNLIEGHDTHPIDIERALNEDFSENKKKRDLQIEARSHVKVHAAISNLFLTGKSTDPFSIDFIKGLHKNFYSELPESLRLSLKLDGTEIPVVPGEYRTNEVKVGKHIAAICAH